MLIIIYKLGSWKRSIFYIMIHFLLESVTCVSVLTLDGWLWCTIFIHICLLQGLQLGSLLEQKAQLEKQVAQLQQHNQQLEADKLKTEQDLGHNIQQLKIQVRHSF